MLREEHKYSQEYLSEYLGKNDYSTYGKIENGKSRISNYDLYKIASLYNISVEELINPSYHSKKEVVQLSNEDQAVYHYKKNTLNINIELDGSDLTLDKSLDMIKKINELLKH